MEYHVQAFREPQTDEEREFANPFVQVELVFPVEDGYLLKPTELVKKV